MKFLLSLFFAVSFMSCGTTKEQSSNIKWEEGERVTREISGSAATGTPDSYRYSVMGGDSFSARIWGDSNQNWVLWVNAYDENGRHLGSYAEEDTSAYFTTPFGATLVIVTFGSNEEISGHAGRYQGEVSYVRYD